MSNIATFRFYEELNFFLAKENRRRDFTFEFKGHPAIKDAIEAIGVPHTEVEVILVNGRSVGFGHQLQHGDRVSVYPMFESLDVSPIIRLRDKPLRESRFICDVHLGKLATILRLLGFDTVYRNDLDDPEIIDRALREHRIILTCDRGILKHSIVTHGVCLHSRQAMEQAAEVIRRFDLFEQAQPFSRCTVCNAQIQSVDKQAVQEQLAPKVKQNYTEFRQCTGCQRIYWQGSHYTRIRQKIAQLLDRNSLFFRAQD
ncbi:Mut7-C ubiquitin/RNAse domain-containing protein [candidate division KSB1 bacterium]|nr:Mut7-C ubiquitin/RNAse domain-containing protein [candidate division KSB1 bacterium]RQW03346.1 MAG: twitching motility protein PilT [candidate division KSB1 bacterium]